MSRLVVCSVPQSMFIYRSRKGGRRGLIICRGVDPPIFQSYEAAGNFRNCV